MAFKGVIPFTIWASITVILLLCTLVNGNVVDTTHSATAPSSQISSHDNSSNHTVHEDHSIHIVKWRFSELSAPIIISIFMLAVSILKVLFHHAECLSTVLPESCLLIIFGVAVGALLQHEFGYGFEQFTPGVVVPDLKLEASLFLNFLLPPIVLDSAYSLNDRVFFNNIGTILLYAVVGTLMNFFMIGPALYGLSEIGLMGGLHLKFIHCLVFASFIVAVDPVAVLAIFQEVGVNNMLYFLVFGESLLNDAVTVVLYNMMKAFNNMETIPISQIGLGLVVFLCDSIGSLLIGIIFGVLTALLTKVTGHVKIVEPIVIIVMAYLSYMAAELIHWSGIICMIGCGLVQAQYAHQNISRKSLTTVKFFVKMLASTSDAVIFLFLGLEVVHTYHEWNTEFVLWSLFLCLFCRAISVAVLTLVSSKAVKRVEKIGLREQFIMWYGGLRGAVCFALATTLDRSFQHRQIYLTATLVIVFFTVFIQGITIKPLVSLCRIKRKEEKMNSVASEFNSHVTDHVMAGVEVIVGQFFGDNYVRAFFQRMNDNYIKRWLQKNPMSHNEQILQYYQKIAVKDHVNHIYDATSKEVKVGLANEKTDEEPIIIPADGDIDREIEKESVPRRRKYSRSRAKRKSVGDDDTMSEMQRALAKTSLSTMHHTYDPNLTHDDETDIVNQLKAKHDLLQKTRQRRARSPNGSPQNSLRRRKFSQMSGDYESHTDYESRPTSVMTEHGGRDNLSFITEGDDAVFRDVKKKLSVDHSQKIQMDEINAKNAKNARNSKDFGNRRNRRKNSGKPNGTAAKHDYTDNNLNQNNSTAHSFYYGADAPMKNLNGHIPKESKRRADYPVDYLEPPEVSIISGRNVQEARPAVVRHPPSPTPAPVIQANSNDHIIRSYVDPDFEEVSYL